jgi:hypothetical protein
MTMRLVPALALVLTVSAACDKKGAPERAADPVAVAAAPAVVAEAPKPPPPPAPPAPPKPVVKTGVLDLQLQEIDGGWKLITPRATQTFTAKPSVERQDAKTPFGDTIPGAVAMVESGDRFGGLIYIPIPKNIPYDVKKGLKGARDGMLGMFEGAYDAKDEPAKLGPWTANHVVAEGSREGHRFHVEAWIAYDPVGHTVYGLMALRMPTDLDGIGAMHDAFAIREDAVADVEPVKKLTKAK